jgi:hypothetical protein
VLDSETEALITELVDELYEALVEEQVMRFWEGGIVRSAPAGAPPEFITVEIEGLYDANVMWRGVPPTPIIGDNVVVWENPTTHRREILGAGGVAGASMPLGAAHEIFKVNAAGTAADFEPFDWDEMSGVGGADMVHDHHNDADGGQDLRQIQEFEFDDATILTINAGSVTRTQVYHIIAAEAGVADDLDNVLGGVGGDELIIRPDTGDTITCRHNQGGAGDFWFAGAADIVLDGQDHLRCIHDGTSWCDQSGGAGGAGGNTLDQAYDQGGAGAGRIITADTGAVEISGGGLDTEDLRLFDTTELTIVAGAVTRTQAYHRIDTVGGAAAESDLDTIAGGATGDILIIRPENDARTVKVKHQTGNIWTREMVDVNLTDTEEHMSFIYDGNNWCSLHGGYVYVDRGDPATDDFREAGTPPGGLTVDSAWHALNLAAIVTDTDAVAVHLEIWIRDNLTGQNFYVRKNGNVNSIVAMKISSWVANVAIFAGDTVSMDANRQVAYIITAGTDDVGLSVKGWWKPA